MRNPFGARPTDPDVIYICERSRQITELVKRMPRQRETSPQVASARAVMARCDELLRRDGEAAYGPVRELLDAKFAALQAVKRG